MGRPFQPRDNYRKDAMSLNRLISVLERDTVRNPDWVAEVKALLEKAMGMLVTAPGAANSHLRPTPPPSRSPAPLKKSA